MAAFQQPWFCEHPFGVSTRFQPPSKMNTAIVRFMESCFSKLRFHKWGTVGQRPKFCVLWSGLEIGAWPVSVYDFLSPNKTNRDWKRRHEAMPQQIPQVHRHAAGAPKKRAPGPSASPGEGGTWSNASSTA